MNELVRARVRGLIIDSKWNAYKLEERGSKIIVYGLYPHRNSIRWGTALYLPFVFNNCEIEIRL